jgi:hypothetical protein
MHSLQMNISRLQIHSSCKYFIIFPLLADMNHGYMLRLKLAILKSISGIYNSKHKE